MGTRDELHGDDPGPPQPPRRRSRRGMARVGHGPCAAGPVERHIAQHNVVFLPCVQILDLPVRHMGDQVVEVLRKFDTPSVKQIFAVPKISFDRVPQRSAVRRPQKAKQLVEVPTESGCALAVLASKVFSRRELRDILAGQGSTASGPELIVDFPGPRGDLQWSHPEQRTIGQNVDIPVQRGRGGRGGGSLQGFSPGQNSTAFHGAEHVDVPVPRGEGLQGLRPGQGSRASSSSSRTAEGAFDGGFRTFPGVKKSAGFDGMCGAHPAGYFSPAGVVVRSSSWTPAAYGQGTLLLDEGGQDDFFQYGDEGDEEEELEMFDESISPFERSGWRPRRL